MRMIDTRAAGLHAARMTDTPDEVHRDTWLAARRGLRLRCPACGQGKLLAGYLRPAAACGTCGEPTGEIRADDAPAWATILLVGHIASPLFFLFATQDANAGLMAFFLITTVVLGLTFFLLPRMKGLFVGLIWATRAGETTHEADAPVRFETGS
jgi:uncharacterized protein (DUF983 family)